MTANEAEKSGAHDRRRIWDLARQGQIDALFLNVRKGAGAECWIRRESLNQWIAARDAELAPYMPRPEAKEALGLKICTVASSRRRRSHPVRERTRAKLPAPVSSSCREDVMRIKGRV